MNKWKWEDVDPARSGASGDLAKIFRNEGVIEPGVLAIDAPSTDATLMAREVIQNSWDAARELQSQFQEAGEEPPEFEIDFRFHEVEGGDRARLIDELGLSELAARSGEVDRAKVGLPPSNVLDALDSDMPLRTLEIRERATTGMYGSWESAESKLYLALVSLGFTEKDSGSGGSYGYGKAGLIRGSAIRTVVAYTCFRERADDPGVTRRLLGMTYWDKHRIDGVVYTGYARLGVEDASGVVVPYENEAADDLAKRLGLGERDPDLVDDLGTTFLIVDPTVDPEDLCKAVERSWWPALESGSFSVDVVMADGEKLIPRPMKDDVLKTFVHAHEVATMPRDNTVENEEFAPFKSLTLPSERQVSLGRLGMVADPEGWSYPATASDDAENGSVDHRSLVALVRGPEMVVEYFDAGRTVPYVRGVFVASPDVDDLLRQTEPKAHDAWDPTVRADGIDPDAPVVAEAVLRRIKQNVNRFRARLKPPVPDRREIRLPELENLFRQLFDGAGRATAPPPKPPRDVAISVLDQHPEAVPGTDGKIRLRARAKYALSPNFTAADVADVRIDLRYVFLEDDRAGEECDLAIEAPEGFAPDPDKPGSFTGKLGREPVVFTIESASYEPDWTGRLVARGELVAAEQAGTGADSGEAA